MWDRWASYDVIENHIITTDDSANGNEESALLRTSLSLAISSLWIIFWLKSILSLVKRGKSSKYRE